MPATYLVHTLYTITNIFLQYFSFNLCKHKVAESEPYDYDTLNKLLGILFWWELIIVTNESITDKLVTLCLVLTNLFTKLIFVKSNGWKFRYESFSIGQQSFAYSRFYPFFS